MYIFFSWINVDESQRFEGKKRGTTLKDFGGLNQSNFGVRQHGRSAPPPPHSERCEWGFCELSAAPLHSAPLFIIPLPWGVCCCAPPQQAPIHHSLDFTLIGGPLPPFTHSYGKNLVKENKTAKSWEKGLYIVKTVWLHVMFDGNIRPRTIKPNSELSAAISLCSLYFSYYYLFCTHLFVIHFIVINE